MRALLVDDEPLALRSMEKLLEVQNDVDIIAALVDPREAIRIVEQQRLDVIFVDLEMPEIGGMELAEQLYRLQPDLHIVFVTAFHQYAVEAFELHALDYVLKPVFADRLNKTLDRLRKVLAKSKISSRSIVKVQLNCFQSLHWLSGNEDVRNFSWRTSKTQELFTFLVHHRRGPVIRKEYLIELLWPEQEMTRASVQLHTAVYQLRKMLKIQGLSIQVVYEQEGYRLQFDNVFVDVDMWEHELLHAPELSVSTVSTYKALLAIYKGDYLGESSFEWAEAERERLRLVRLHHLQRVADFCLKMGLLNDASELYRLMKEQYPLVESGYYGLMQVYVLSNHFADIKLMYEELRSRLEEELAIMPSPTLTKWYHDTFELVKKQNV
ncbi:hypothetical protein A8709_01130 [Paenibacillus pectinilyticus]|uniref:Response regulatory domain-containing protein n=1 Tax=Paenibacillus pectinilyticus TaxID=512399 RepID=A0A1C0ZZ05_9BACL|nr:response regulator [Paenibacillus pectinilyticus]OCT13259.1 hypothetical protein A8709_01130 [Paenibacillus pectinilyticus]